MPLSEGDGDLRLAAYIRVSAVMGRSGDSFQSPEQQRKTISSYAKSHGHTIVSWHTDLDQSGGKRSRPEFDVALRQIEIGVADGLIVARLDRFMRSLSDALSVIEQIEGGDSGHVLISVHENLDPTTPEGRFQRNLFLSLGEFERERIAAKWYEANQHSRSRGVTSGKLPYGYMRGDDGRWLIDPERAEVVREIYRRRAIGQSWKTLVQWLNEEHPIKNGNGWRISTLNSLIARRTYRGEYPGTQSVDPEAPDYYPSHEAIVTEHEWLSAQGRKRAHVRASDGGALLAGIVKCSTCHGTMTRIGTGKGGYYNYRCAEVTCEARMQISCMSADRYVEQVILALVGEDVVKVDHAEDSGAVMVAYEEAIAELQAFLLNVPATTPGYAQAVAARQEKVDTLAAEVQRLAASGTSEVVVAEQWRDNPALTVELKRQIVGAAFSRIEILPSELGKPGSGNRGRSRKQSPVSERMRFHFHDGTSAVRPSSMK